VQAVLLGQLDSVRRELVEVVDRYGPHILFGKEIVRDVLAFAQVRHGSVASGSAAPNNPAGSRQIASRAAGWLGDCGGKSSIWGRAGAWAASLSLQHFTCCLVFCWLACR
jgi:hypothetical protein